MSSELVTRLKTLLDEAQRLQMRVHEECYLLQKLGTQPSNADLCDAGFLCREASDAVNECRKELDAQVRRIGYYLAYAATKAKLLDDSLELRIDGELALGLPDVKDRPKIPSAGTPEYERLMEWLGVQKELVATGVLSLSYSRMTEHLRELTERGTPPPSDLVGTFPEYQTIFRTKKSRK